MAEFKDPGESVPVGAEKSPARIGGFLLTLFILLVVVLGIVLLFLHGHGHTITQ